ncbi:MAG: chemotaxis protein CheW [Verrucomicrobia bacterium]|nr:chemotaxis protein CheW [Verrucomicrobiota bacterium]
MITAPEAGLAVLPVRAGTSIVAIPVPQVSEIMRALPVEPFGGAPRFVAGLAIIRGRPTPVIHLHALLTDGPATPPPAGARFVALRVAERHVALCVDAVLPLRTLDHRQLGTLPPLWQGGHPPAAALGALDRDLLILLEATRLLPDGWSMPAETGGTA